MRPALSRQPPASDAPARKIGTPVDYPVSEAVNFDNLAALREAAERQIEALAEHETLQVRFTSTQHSGSAAVALMIAIYRRGHVAGRAVEFVDVPEDVINIIEVSGLSDILPVAGTSKPA